MLRPFACASRFLERGRTDVAAVALCQAGQPPLASETTADALRTMESDLRDGWSVLSLLRRAGRYHERRLTER